MSARANLAGAFFPIAVTTGSPRDESVRSEDVWPIELVGQVCPPSQVQKIGAHGVMRPPANSPQGRGYKSWR